MLGLGDLLILSLAVWQAVEVWHHSLLMASWRARSECWQGGVRGWLGDLLSCPWCLSVWTAWVFWLVWLMPFPGVSWPSGGFSFQDATQAVWSLLNASWWILAALTKGFVAGLAISRLANVGNDVTRPLCRTPVTDVPPSPPIQKPDFDDAR